MCLNGAEIIRVGGGKSVYARFSYYANRLFSQYAIFTFDQTMKIENSAPTSGKDPASGNG